MDIPVDWLLEREPWTVYRTLVDLMDAPADDHNVCEARQALLIHPLIRRTLAMLSQWPVVALSSHKTAGHPLHLLVLMADFGLNMDDPGMQEILARVIATQAPEGPYRVKMNIPTHFGGTGEEQLAWALCDAPLVLYALIQFGLSHQPGVKKALEYLIGLRKENGWPCAVSKELGRFRGPGRKDDPCPYATLLMLKCLALSPSGIDSPAAQNGVETLLSLWDQSRERHPYMFYMGTDFRKLKAPLVWYDLLHVLDVLSRFPWARQEGRLQTMLHVLTSQADENGRYTPESIWTFWKDYDFGQKKLPSRWLTALAWRVQKRFR